MSVWTMLMMMVVMLMSMSMMIVMIIMIVMRVMRVMIYSLDDKTVLLARNYHGIYHGIYHGLVKSCGRQVAAVLSEAGDDLRAKAVGTSGDFVVEAVGMALMSWSFGCDRLVPMGGSSWGFSGFSDGTWSC